jgi:hypothetical protein
VLIEHPSKNFQWIRPHERASRHFEVLIDEIHRDAQEGNQDPRLITDEYRPDYRTAVPVHS